MATTLQIKRSSVAGKVPNTSTLSIGELGLNLTDQILYSSNGTGVFEIGANLTSLSVGSVYANGTYGNVGDILVSNGSSVYWGSISGTGTVTSVTTGNGLTGGPITSSGTVSVLANSGIVANSTGLYVNSAYIATLASNSATYANSSVSNTFTVGTSTYFVANGNVGIGNTSPTSKLHVEGNAYVSGNTQLGTAVFFKNSDISSSTISQLNGTNAPAMQLKRYTSRSSPGILLNSIWFTSSAINQTTASTGSTSVELDSNNVLAQQNLTNPQTYRIYGTYTDASNYERLSLSSNSTASYIQAESAGTGTARPLYLGANNSTAMTVAANSNIGIGTTSPTSPLHIRSSGISWKHDSITHGHLYTQFINSGGQAYFTIRTDNGTPSLRFETSGKDILLLPASNVGIGTTTPAYKLQVNGSFAATTKSFVIDHPTKPDKKLRYGSLEGPENGVYVRGKLVNDNVIELPEYWTKLVDEDSITVNLTSHGYAQNLFVKEIKDNKVSIKSTTKKPINCFYTVYGERKDVEKLEVEI